MKQKKCWYLLEKSSKRIVGVADNPVDAEDMLLRDIEIVESDYYEPNINFIKEIGSGNKPVLKPFVTIVLERADDIFNLYYESEDISEELEVFVYDLPVRLSENEIVDIVPISDQDIPNISCCRLDLIVDKVVR